MKKVFFNRRFICFCEIFVAGHDKSSIVVDLKLVQELPKLLNDFLHCGDKNYYVVCKDEDEAFVAFCDLFDVIFAAGGLVFNKNDDVLFIYRFGHWDLPKGKQEKDEAICRAAVREVEEECGISGVALGDFCTETYHFYYFDGRLTMKRTFWYKMFYNGNSFKPQAEEGIERVEFVNKGKIHEYLKTSYASIVEVFLAANML